jgi:hypothetical protein
MLSKRGLVVVAVLMLALAGGISGQSLQFSTTTYSAGAGATGTNTVAVADFNRDGALDVIASNSTTVPASGSPNYTGSQRSGRQAPYH